MMIIQEKKSEEEEGPEDGLAPEAVLEVPEQDDEEVFRLLPLIHLHLLILLEAALLFLRLAVAVDTEAVDLSLPAQDQDHLAVEAEADLLDVASKADSIGGAPFPHRLDHGLLQGQDFEKADLDPLADLPVPDTGDEEAPAEKDQFRHYVGNL